LKPLILAHRGASGNAPENTIAAFLEAKKQQSDGIEMDVHLTADNIPVVIHDETIDRTTDGIGYIKDYKYSELNQFDAGKYFSNKFIGEFIPSLNNVLELANSFKIINIELKTNKIWYDNIEKIVLDIIKNHKLEDKIIVSSFNHLSLKKLRMLNSNIELAALYYAVINEPWDYANNLGINIIHPHYQSIDKKTIDKCHRENIMVNVFDVNNEEEILVSIDMGSDMIITDYPEKAIKIREANNKSLHSLIN